MPRTHLLAISQEVMRNGGLENPAGPLFGRAQNTTGQVGSLRGDQSAVLAGALDHMEWGQSCGTVLVTAITRGNVLDRARATPRSGSGSIQ